jgi:hypothetical protein
MTLDLLVITQGDLRRPKPEATASLGLAWGLDRRGIRWRTAFVGAGRADPRGFDAVLSWWGTPPRHKHRFQACALRHIYPRAMTPARQSFEGHLEARCAELGIPVVNPLSRRLGMRHSRGLAAWQVAGIPCARAERFARLDEVTLPYPLVLRADGGEHALDDAFLVGDRTAAEAVVNRRLLEDRRPLSLAMEFRDTRYADGLYRKRRTFVVGDRLLPRQHMLSEVWQVKLKTALASPRSVAEDRRFRAAGEELEESAALVLRAGRALGPDIVALDYSPGEDGCRVFWEGNPIFGMAGLGDDERSLAYRAQTGRSRAECEEEHLALGLAVADLVIQRVAERGERRGEETAGAAGPGRAAADR